MSGTYSRERTSSFLYKSTLRMNCFRAPDIAVRKASVRIDDDEYEQGVSIEVGSELYELTAIEARDLATFLLLASTAADEDNDGEGR